jgi:tetratricopeptide (TPR) repeat protein
MASASACCILLVAACFGTLRLSWGSYLASVGSKESLARAVGLMPDDAALLTRYAEVAGPEEAGRALERAVSLNPGAWQAWIQLGLFAEGEGDFRRAEQSYRQAAAASRLFQPAWTLANYYFRRGNRQEFGIWATRALQMASGDARPLFDLCWRVEPAPGLVVQAVPDRPDLLRQYLAYLTSEGRLEAAEETARRILLQTSAADVPDLVAYCGRLLETNSPARAVDVWNVLCRRKAIPYRALAPESRLSLTNGGFEVAPSSLGFDWRIVPWAGVSVVHVPNPACLRITFSGAQPESCELLTQFVPVEPGGTYQLSYQYQTPGIRRETGIRWTVYDTASGAELAADPPQLSSETWERQVLHFSTPPNCRLARLVLVYRRAPATTRIEGPLWLRQIALD